MKTALEIANDLGIAKITVVQIIKQNQIEPIKKDGNKNYFDNDQVEQIKRILRFELKIN
jgi:predicted site-specific integrase-resolvase